MTDVSSDAAISGQKLQRLQPIFSCGKEQPMLTKRTKGNGGLVRRPEPWIEHLRDEFDRTMSRAWRLFESEPWAPLAAFDVWPPLDVTEDEKVLMVIVDVPGLGPNDLDVEVEGNILHLRGGREEKHEQQHKGLLRYERHVGRFERAVTLPSYVDPERVEARYDKGTLTIKVPKIPEKAPKRVKIESV
jgi:HSP20 family protein